MDDSVPRWGENEWVGENYGGADTSFHPLAASTPARRPRHVELDYAGLYSDPSFDFDTVDQVVQSDVYEPEAQTVATPRHRGTVVRDRSQRRGGCEMCKRCISQPARIWLDTVGTWAVYIGR